MAVRLEQLLADPELGLELVAGAAGVHARGTVRWAHISEIPDPTPWLAGGEILLTTGLAVKDSPQLQRDLIIGLERRGCAAVGFGLGIWLDDVPPAMIEAAEQRAMPLFTVPYAVPFIAITKYVSSRVYAAHYMGLRRALDLHRRVLGVVTSSGGLGDVLAETTRSLGDVEAVIFDPFGHILASAGDSGRELDHAALWRALPGIQRHRADTTVEGHVATITPLRAADDVRAVMVVVSAEPLDEARHLLVQQGAAAAAVTLSRVLSARKARRASVAELLDDVIEGRASRQRLAHRLEQLDLDPSEGYRVLTILPDDRRRASVLAATLEDMAVSQVRAAVGTAGDVIHAIVQPANAEVGAALMAAVGGRGHPVPRIGRSREQHDVDGLAVALRESLVAAERSTGGLLDVADLGVHGLLAGVAADAAADAFVMQMLGPVLDHDATGDGVLVDTVRAYLAAGCRPGPAAEALRVHRHTLSYRLDRVAQLTGRDPRSGDNLVPYGIALELLDRRDAPPSTDLQR